MKYVIWDFNGTILDDLELCFDILNEMLEENSLDKITLDRYLDIFTFPIKDYYIEAGFDFNKVSFEKLSNDFITRYQPKSLNVKIHNGLIETVNYFHTKGITQVVLSASRQDLLIEQMHHYKINHLFDEILGISDIYAKSKVELAKKYINDNNINPKDVLFIGDTLHDAEVAEAVGADIILYTEGHQSKKRLENYKTIGNFKDLIV